MAEGIRDLAKRLALRRGIAAVAGLVGIGAAVRAASERPAMAQVGTPQVFRLTGSDWHVRSTDFPRGARPDGGDQLSMYGVVNDERGTKLGEFHSAAFVMDTSFGHAGTNVEVHTFNLAAGTLVGIGMASAERNVYAVVGGTGRYAGARGSYLATLRPLEFGGDGTATFDVTLVP